MDKLQTLAAELLLTLNFFFAAPVSQNLPPPRIETLASADLQLKACNRPCRILAWYAPDGVIYLDAKLDPAQNIFSRSILVHELVHYVQRAQRGEASGCEDWLEREREAFAAQARWLRANGVRPPPLIQRLGSIHCINRPPLANPNAGIGG